MNFSAAASSSPVVTPGRALLRSIFRQRTRISPAFAIFSICSGVFVTIKAGAYSSSSIRRVASRARMRLPTSSGLSVPSTRLSSPRSS